MTNRHASYIAAALVFSGGFACSSSNGSGPSDAPTTGGATSVSGNVGSGGSGPNGPGTGSVTSSGQGGSLAPNGQGGAIAPIGLGGAIAPIGAGGGLLPGAAGAPILGIGGTAGAPPVGGTAGVMGAGGGMGVPLTPKGKNCLQPGNGNYMAPGPYKVATTDVDLGMINASQHTGKYTIYYPTPFESACLHPIVAWGNGTGVTDSNFTYNFLNNALASWGIVVAASAEDNTGSGLFHKAGIDYLLKQNEDMSSMFFHKLSTRAGVSGHSQGGIGAGVASAHPNVVALVVEGMTFTATMKVPGLVLTGTNDIVMNAQNTVTAATGPDFVAVWNGGNHVGTETVLGYLGLDTTSMDATGSQKGSIQFQRLYSAWFRCFLADDDVACKLFSGGTPTGCGICKDPGWATLSSKNL